MKRIATLLLLAFAFTISTALSGESQWEKYAEAPPGGVFNSVTFDGNNTFCLIASPKIFVRSTDGAKWDSIGIIKFDDGRIDPACDGNNLFIPQEGFAVYCNIASRVSYRIAYPEQFTSSQAQFYTARNEQAAFWFYTDSKYYRAVYDISSGNWLAAEEVDSPIYYYTDGIGNIYKYDQSESTYQFQKSEDFGKTWTQSFELSSTNLMFDRSGNAYINTNDRMTSIDAKGNSITTYPGYELFTPKSIDKYGDNKLIINYGTAFCIYDLATGNPLDTVLATSQVDTRFRNIFCAGKDIYTFGDITASKLSIESGTSSDFSEGINTGYGFFLMKQADKIILRTLFGIYSVSPEETKLLNRTYSSLQNMNGKNAFVASNNAIYAINELTQKVDFSDANGENWRSLELPAGVSPKYILEEEPYGIFIAGSDGQIYGAALNSTTTGSILNLELTDGEELIYVKVYGMNIIGMTPIRIFHSEDLGGHLYSKECNYFSEITDAFVDDKNRIIVFNNVGAYISPDNGLTWTVVTQDNGNIFYPYYVAGKGYIMPIYNDNSALLFGNDDTFTVIPINYPEVPTTSFTVIGDYVYATTIGGSVWRMPLSPLAVNDEITIPAKALVVPNPAANTISISGTDASNIDRIEIVNSLGETVKTSIFATDKTDISDMPEGIYFAKIFSEGTFTAVKFSVVR